MEIETPVEYHFEAIIGPTRDSPHTLKTFAKYAKHCVAQTFESDMIVFKYDKTEFCTDRENMQFLLDDACIVP